MKTPAVDIIVGGQAVIEGVMMRAPHAYAVAVRQANGSIVSEQGEVINPSQKYPILKLPILRGSAVLIQSMVLGVKALNFSTNIALQEDKPKQETTSTTGMLISALIFNIAIFILLPFLLTNLIFSLASGKAIAINQLPELFFPLMRPSLLFNLVDGMLRMLLFIGFITFLSRFKDIQRLFEYHGAEHKVVYTWEQGEALTVENARRQPRLHPRCGTSFLMIVMLVSILFFSLLKFDARLLNFLARVFFIPMIAGISYELIRFSALSLKTDAKGVLAILFSLLTQPGLWLQRITTREPSDDQLEVAIYALERSLNLQRQPAALAAD